MEAQSLHIQGDHKINFEPASIFDLEGPPSPGPLPTMAFLSPWQAAQWRAFGSIEPFGALIRRSFDQGTVKRPDETAKAHAMRVDWHRRFDEAEQEVRELLALGRLSASGRKPVHTDAGRALNQPAPEHVAIPAEVFRNKELAFGPQGELKARIGLLGAMFPPYEVRGTDADPGIPLYFDVQIPTAELLAAWELMQFAPTLGHEATDAVSMGSGGPVWWDQYEAERWIALRGRSPSPISHPWRLLPAPETLDALANRAEGRIYQPDWKQHLVQGWFNYHDGTGCDRTAVRNVWGGAAGRAYEKRAELRRLMRAWNAAGLIAADLPTRARGFAVLIQARRAKEAAAKAELLATIRSGRLPIFGRRPAREGLGNATMDPAEPYELIPMEVFADHKLILHANTVTVPPGSREAKQDQDRRNARRRQGPANLSSPAIYPLYVEIRFRVLDVRQLWKPLSEASKTHLTAKAETDLEAWLVERMKLEPGNPPGKAAVKLEAEAAGYKASNEGFKRAYANAVKRADTPAWSRPGRKSKGVNRKGR